MTVAYITEPMNLEKALFLVGLQDTIDPGTSLIGLRHIFLGTTLGDQCYEFRETVLITGADVLAASKDLWAPYKYPQFLVKRKEESKVEYTPDYWNNPLPRTGVLGAKYLTIILSLTTRSVVDVLSPQGTIPERFQMFDPGELLRLTDHLASRGEKTVICVHSGGPENRGYRFYYLG